MEDKMVSGAVEEENRKGIVIIGGGIGGLATALALHRKGFQDVAVYERSTSLRAEGTGIGISANGWRALDELGVGHQLRDKAILLQGVEDIWVEHGRPQNGMPENFDRTGEFRWLKRKDLINVLANALPPKTIRFGYNAVAVKMDSQDMSPVLELDNGKAVRAKVLIGCDGLNSKVANYLGLKPASFFALGIVRGMTNYPNGHLFPPLFVMMSRDHGGARRFGRAPVNDKLVYWFVVVQLSRLDEKFPDDPELLKQATLRIMKGFPADAVDMVDKSDLHSLCVTRCLRYRHPWEILVRRFHKGSVAVLGDAMHVMGPFLGQGGSAALEDAVVLARNLGQKFSYSLDQPEGGTQIMSQKKIEEAFDQYIRERRMRIVRLSMQTYLIGMILGSRRLSIAKVVAIIILVIIFRDASEHVRYDCGKL